MIPLTDRCANSWRPSPMIRATAISARMISATQAGFSLIHSLAVASPLRGAPAISAASIPIADPMPLAGTSVDFLCARAQARPSL